MKKDDHASEAFLNIDITKQTLISLIYKGNIGYVSLFLEKKLFYFLG
ncbi:hypothetical protein NJT12_23265 [Flavobacterium sp. AC]|uniref:Uncharacterized protein n=1 Tax=Flavobacterium azizsancarii TaxID=2961580 RepID=A0ABT4WJ75_9FLAO|nr:hypothetical protein [Flavobacterium azizsancarii]MDA6072545.1 hypothetical protein [Flavobacterium azizsancarii]